MREIKIHSKFYIFEVSSAVRIPVVALPVMKPCVLVDGIHVSENILLPSSGLKYPW
jgi:hypothetical protein